MYDQQNVKLIPFLKNEFECDAMHCTFNQDKQCTNRDIDMLEYTFNFIGKMLNMNSESNECTLDGSTSFVCTYYQLDDKRCPECHSMLTYSQKEVNHVCYVCGHGMED